MQHTPMFQTKIFLSVMNYSFSKLRRNLDASPTIFLEEEFVGVAEDEDQLEGNVQDVLDILLHHIFISTPADTVPRFQEPEVEGEILSIVQLGLLLRLLKVLSRKLVLWSTMSWMLILTSILILQSILLCTR